MKIAYSVLKDR